MTNEPTQRRVRCAPSPLPATQVGLAGNAGRLPHAPCSYRLPASTALLAILLLLAIAPSRLAAAEEAVTLRAIAAKPSTGETVEAEHLRIVWRDEARAARTPDEARLLAVKEACSQLASWLMIGEGPWGLGVFTSFECRHGKTRLSGTAAKPSRWTLVLTSKAARLQLLLLYGAPGEGAEAGARQPVVSLEVAATDQTPLILAKDQLFAATLAGALLDGMPMMTRLETVTETARRIAAQRQPRSGTRASPFVDKALQSLEPKQLVAYHLRYFKPDGLWSPELRGTAVAAADSGKSPRRARWRLKQETTAPARAAVYAHRLEGRGQFAARLLELAERRHQRLSTKLASADRFGGFSLDKIGPGAKNLLDVVSKNTVSSGYVGLRVGREFVAPGAAVLPPATLFGVLGEFRAGKLDGFRVYYDEVPEAKDLTTGEAFFLGYNRFVLGYAFDLELPCFKALGRCLASIAPKAGIWSVRSRLPLATASGEVVPVTYDTRRAFAYGYEVALESERLSGLTRFWHAADTSLPVVDGVVPSSVTSRRFGVDTFFNGPHIPYLGSGWRWSFLVFAFYDILDISGSYEPAATTTALTQAADSAGKEPYLISVSSTFGGFGVSTSW